MTTTADTFEERLLDALLERFDTLGPRPDVSPAPAPQRAIRRYALPVGCLAAATTVASLSIVEMGGAAPTKHARSATPTYALASWTARPTSAGRVQVVQAESLCSSSLDQTGASAPGQKQGPPLTGGPWKAAVVDTRGDLTLVLYSDGPGSMACLSDSSFVWLNALDTTGEAPVADNGASLDWVSTRGAAGDVYTIAAGRTGSEVTGVGLVRADGSEVTATVNAGRFLAWWPRDEGVKSLSVTTDTGTQSYPVAARFARSGPQPTNRVVGPASSP